MAAAYAVAKLIGWAVLGELAAWPGPLFYVDAFALAGLGAIASFVIYTGEQAGEIDFKGLSRLAASPLVAVALIALLSELTLGVGTTSANATAADVGTVTLIGASIEVRLAAAFLFGFFGELSIDLLKTFGQRFGAPDGGQTGK